MELIAINKEITHKNNHPGGSSGGLSNRKSKEDRPGDRGRHERSPGAPMILLGDFNAHNPLWEARKWAKAGEWWRKYSTDTTSCALTKKKTPTIEHSTAANQQ